MYVLELEIALSYKSRHLKSANFSAKMTSCHFYGNLDVLILSIFSL